MHTSLCLTCRQVPAQLSGLSHQASSAWWPDPGYSHTRRCSICSCGTQRHCRSNRRSAGRRNACTARRTASGTCSWCTSGRPCTPSSLGRTAGVRRNGAVVRVQCGGFMPTVDFGKRARPGRRACQPDVCACPRLCTGLLRTCGQQAGAQCATTPSLRMQPPLTGRQLRPPLPT